MRYQKILNTNLNVSCLTLGTWVFAGDSWSGSDEKDCIGAVHAALDHGISLIDTAPIYGQGISEEIVGRSLYGKRDKVLIATKCGLIGKGKNIEVDLSRPSLLREIDGSLKRLKMDFIDIYQCHWPDPKTPIEETMETLNQIKGQGKIRHIGVSNFSPEMIKEACRFAPIVTIQDQYSLLTRSIEAEILPLCRSKNIGLLAYGPLAGGILTGKYTQPRSFPKADARSFFYKFYQGPPFEQVTSLLSQLTKFQRPLNQLALNWVSQQSGTTSVIVGCRNAQQVIDNAKAMEWTLTEDELAEIKKVMMNMKIN